MPTPRPPDLPDYKLPPIIEVVAGIYFNPMEKFLIPHYGLYWDDIKTEFPDIEYASPIIQGGQEGKLVELIDSNKTFLPRLWFISKQKTELIQLQNNAFIFNWRKTSETVVYPHFDDVLLNFNKYYGKLVSLIRKLKFPAPIVNEIELTYVNHIPKEEVWNNYSGIGNIFPDFHWDSESKSVLPIPIGFNHALVFSFPDNGNATLRATIQNGRRELDGKEIIRFDLSVKHPVNAESKNNLEEIFQTARRWIDKGFEEFTSEEIQKNIWRKK